MALLLEGVVGTHRSLFASSLPFPFPAALSRGRRGFWVQGVPSVGSHAVPEGLWQRGQSRGTPSHMGTYEWLGLSCRECVRRGQGPAFPSPPLPCQRLRSPRGRPGFGPKPIPSCYGAGGPLWGWVPVPRRGYAAPEPGSAGSRLGISDHLSTGHAVIL